MLVTYKAILKNNRLEWRDTVPDQLLPDQAVAVHVTILDEPVVTPTDASRGKRMAAALEKLAATLSLEGISDPATWEREIRQDRVLPDRET
jgi:hypothetical protein